MRENNMAANRLVYQLIFRRAFRRERVFRDRLNPFDYYDDHEIRSNFRFQRADIMDLCEVIENDLEFAFEHQGSLPAITYLLVALRFYATGCFQDVVGDIFGIDRSTVSRVILRVSEAFVEKINEFVRLPSPDDANRIINQFYQMAGLLNVIGCIDCTPVKIQAPSEDENVYVNRKGHHSINCQLVCDADMIVINCVVLWPGATHDARILRESKVFRIFQRINRPVPDILLGDSGYPLKEWLLTPFLNPVNRAQRNYNISHCSTRSTIERTNGVIKKRWHCLQTVLRYDPGRASKIMMTCMRRVLKKKDR